MTTRIIPKLSFSGFFFTEIAIPLRFTDFNAGAHLSNDAILKLVTEAHSSYLTSKKLSLDNVENHSIIFSGVTINFMKEIKLSDFDNANRISVKIGLYQTEKTRLYFYHEILSNNAQVLHKALLEVAFVNNSTGKVAEVDDFISLYQ